MLSKAGFMDWGIISKLDEQTRKYPREDIRKEGVAAIQLSLINDISHHYENEKHPKTDPPDEKATKETKFEEMVTPTKMRRWPADVSYLDAYLKPDQDMANLFSKEFPLQGKKGPPPIPVAAPELRRKPWRFP